MALNREAIKMKFSDLIMSTNWLTHIKVFDYDALSSDLDSPKIEDSQQQFYSNIKYKDYMNREVKTITCLGKHEMAVILGR